MVSLKTHCICFRSRLRRREVGPARNFPSTAFVSSGMTAPHRTLGAPEWLILVGATVFIFVLALSAVFDASIRWLHFFQAWMYLATMFLAPRGSRWGCFIGISAAGLWDYTNLFVTTFFRNGLEQLAAWITTGHLGRVDLLIAVPAWLSNFLVVAGCLWTYARLRDKSISDFARFLAAFALSTAFFAGAVALCQPRYLPLFRAMLHPRWVF